MKSFVAVAAVLCAVIFALASATPLPADHEADALLYDQASLYDAAALPEDNELMRPKRATCDLLSGFGVGDTACALHCIGHGNRGGYCERGTCHCRN